MDNKKKVYPLIKIIFIFAFFITAIISNVFFSHRNSTIFGMYPEPVIFVISLFLMSVYGSKKNDATKENTAKLLARDDFEAEVSLAGFTYPIATNIYIGKDGGSVGIANSKGVTVLKNSIVSYEVSTNKKGKGKIRLLLNQRQLPYLDLIYSSREKADDIHSLITSSEHW